MTEVASFGNIVNSLRSVRDDYHEQLRSVPQYEAFLLVESSTEKVAGTLNSTVSSSTPSMATEVVQALEVARAKFRQHLTSIPEYRALLAIDKLITEVSADLGLKDATIEPLTTATSTVETSTTAVEPNAAATAYAPPTFERAADAVATQQEAATAQQEQEDIEVAELEAEKEAMSRLETALRPEAIADEAAPPRAGAEAALASATPDTSQQPTTGAAASTLAEHEPPPREEEKAA